jgi:PAS domain S-box-containing protein
MPGRASTDPPQRSPETDPSVPDATACAQLAAIVQSSDDAIVSKDLNGIVTSWNPAAERMFGYTAAEAVGRSIRLIIPDDRQSEEDRVLSRIARGETVEHFDTVRRRKDGAAIFVSVTVSPVVDRDGTIIGASKIARDISGQKRASERAAFLADIGPLLAGSLDYEVTLRSIARLATNPLSLASWFADYAIIDIRDRDGRLRRVAAAHRDPAKEPLLEQARQYAPDPERGLLARPLRTGQPVLLATITEPDITDLSVGPAHTRIIRQLAPRSLMSVPLAARGVTFGIFTLVRSSVPEPYDRMDLAFALEVAQRAALAVDNARMYAESQQAVQARDQVLAVVSHDFRNALGVIATTARLLQVAAGDEEQRKRRLDTLVRVSDRTTRLVRDLLDVSRVQAGHRIAIDPKEQDVASLVSDACDSFRGQAEEKLITLTGEVAAGLPHVLADRDRTFQVLTNLVSNAIKFTPDGGTVVVRAVAAVNAIQFSVEDTGPGIRPDDLPHIFDRFWQATRTASLGSGLGLPIAKGIVEAHGGTIWVESQPGVGTTLHFTLPAISAAPGLPGGQPAP